MIGVLALVDKLFTINSRCKQDFCEKTKFDRPQRIGYKMHPFYEFIALISRAQAQW